MSDEYAPLSPIATGLRGRCPRCGEGPLFSGFLKLAPRCSVCGLDFDFADPADGPAFFAMTFMAFPAVGFGWWLDATYEPPIWVHLVTTLPVLLILCIAPLRPLKGWLVASQYVHRAEQGRLAPTEQPGSGPTRDAP